MLNEIPAVFHRASNYDSYFIIKELANEFEGQYECLGNNKDKYKKFSVPIKKEIKKTVKYAQGTIETISLTK